MPIVTLQHARQLVRAAQADGRTVVHCHGCFDLVHPGHVRHLQQAARLGDHLLVTITGDAQVNKGDGRPLIPQELRAENLAALDCVDWVAVNPAPTAAELLEQVRPDVYVKGREYEDNHDPRFLAEQRIVEQHGGRVVFTSGDVVFSSTALISAIERTTARAHDAVQRILNDPDAAPNALNRLIDAFRGRSVTVVGEWIVDTYVICDRPDVAGEGPMLSLRPLEYRSFDGGAAIIARHLAAMGAAPTLITAMADDLPSRTMRLRLEAAGVNVQTIPVESKPIEKQRYLVGSTKVVKLDLGEPITLDATRQTQLIQRVVHAASAGEALIIADYGQGLFTQAMMHELCRAARPVTPFISGDVSGRRSNLLAMRELDLLCPSELDLRSALHEYDDGLSAVVWKLLHGTNARSAVVTMGAAGAIAFAPTGSTPLRSDDWQARLQARHVPAFADHALDELGCGDALLAAATLARISGGSLVAAGVLGSLAAAAQSQSLGNAVIDAAALRRGVQRLAGAHLTCSTAPSPALVNTA